MVCSIADNNPLKKLERELGLPTHCHGKRRDCIHGFATREGEFVLGLPGTALGYCQALFGYAGSPKEHTAKVAALLQEIGAPWSCSHEMFWGFRRSEEPSAFIEDAIQPLIGSGRVPILITGLDPAANAIELAAIMGTMPAVPKNETVLVRVVLERDDSILATAKLIRTLVQEARGTKAMPKWWPLLQSALPRESWLRLKTELGDDWAYANVAVNPFTSQDVFEEIEEQVTVAQIPVGTQDGIHSDGTVELSEEVKVLGSAGKGVYAMDGYASKLGALSSSPTLIVLGPSRPTWTDLQNQMRIATLLPLVRHLCDSLWYRLTPERRDAIWRLVA